MGQERIQQYAIRRGVPEDADAIYALYRSLIGVPYGTWSEEYPSRELITEDLRTQEVFVMEGGEHLIAAIVSEESDEFDGMAPWYPDVRRWAQLSRLGVARDCQGRGIARRMLAYAMEQAKAEGYDAVRFLVGAQNLPAQRAYAGFHFDICGEADAWGDRWLCYQKRL